MCGAQAVSVRARACYSGVRPRVAKGPGVRVRGVLGTPAGRLCAPHPALPRPCTMQAGAGAAQSAGAVDWAASRPGGRILLCPRPIQGTSWASLLLASLGALCWRHRRFLGTPALCGPLLSRPAGRAAAHACPCPARTLPHNPRVAPQSCRRHVICAPSTPHVPPAGHASGLRDPAHPQRPRCAGGIPLEDRGPEASFSNRPCLLPNVAGCTVQGPAGPSRTLSWCSATAVSGKRCPVQAAHGGLAGVARGSNLNTPSTNLRKSAAQSTQPICPPTPTSTPPHHRCTKRMRERPWSMATLPSTTNASRSCARFTMVRVCDGGGCGLSSAAGEAGVAAAAVLLRQAGIPWLLPTGDLAFYLWVNTSVHRHHARLPK